MSHPTVDAHVHLWRLARGDYDWLRSDLPIHRDYDLDDLRGVLGETPRVVLVQAAATEAETAFIIASAHDSRGMVAAVVGWTDLAAADASDRIPELASEKLLRGLRPMLQDIQDSHWIVQDDVQPGLAAMAQAGLRLDLLVTPRHLALVPELAQRHPDLAMVIDHAAKPAIAEGAFEPWATDIARIARETAACCKVSGLVTEARPDWSMEHLRPYVDHLLACFGPDRLLWGSDWPVVDMAGGYARWRKAAQALLPETTHAQIFGRTAARFYGLNWDASP